MEGLRCEKSDLVDLNELSNYLLQGSALCLFEKGRLEIKFPIPKIYPKSLWTVAA